MPAFERMQRAFSSSNLPCFVACLALLSTSFSQRRLENHSCLLAMPSRSHMPCLHFRLFSIAPAPARVTPLVLFVRHGPSDSLPTTMPLFCTMRDSSMRDFWSWVSERPLSCARREWTLTGNCAGKQVEFQVHSHQTVPQIF